jgi:hypothetical protein
VLIDIISKHRKIKIKKDRENLQKKICTQIKDNISNFQNNMKGPIKLSQKEYVIKEQKGLDRKFAESLFFSKTIMKCDKLNDLQELAKIKIQKSKPEKAFNDIISKLNGTSLTKHSLESNFIENENRFYKKKLGTNLFHFN